MSIYKLHGVVQHYDWGGSELIPGILGVQPEANTPYAEYWMGAHPKGDARLEDPANGQLQLSELIRRDPEKVLGGAVADRFQAQLPFLFKLLDVAHMLSIQAHPSLEQARAGFERENREGIPRDAPHRNYRDANHKPELMVALSPFWLLHGFRSLEEALRVFGQYPELAALRNLLRDLGIEQFYRRVMEASQQQVDEWLDPLLQRLSGAYRSGELKDMDDPGFWAARAAEEHPPAEGKYDRGIFSIFLFNLLSLEPGEGIFQAAGIPHAYLKGLNVELMANSDNVFRGGLTVKHVDIPELLQTLDFSAVTPRRIKPQRVSEGHWEYPVPVPDFTLSRLEPGRGKEYRSLGPEILLVFQGRVTDHQGRQWDKGSTLFVPDGQTYGLSGADGAVIFRAAVGREG